MEEAPDGTTMLQQQHRSSSPLFPDHPPLPPQYLHLKPPAAPRSLGEPFHSRSCSQPAACFSFDSSPTTSLSDSISMDDRDIAQVAAADNDLPPRGAHRRSQSDVVPFAFLPPLPLPPGAGVKMEVQWDGGFDVGDDLFSTYMNLDGFDMPNSSEDNRGRESWFKTDGRENEAESNSLGDPAQVTAASRHCRSLSMDSFMRKFNFEEEGSAKLQPPRGLRARSSARLVDTEPNTFSLDFGNGQFTPPEMKKIMENEKLVELAMADPKRVKRILANRQSAARSKERKMRYIAELEHKVQLLQTETTAMSAQLTLLQRDSAGLVNQNNELKFRLQAMEQQAQLRDALNEALTAEVQRLKLAAIGLVDAHDSTNSNQQTSLNARTMDFRELFSMVSKGRLLEDTGRRYFQQLISAVAFCHARGVYHRDLKPENLLLDEKGDLKVSDFGLSAVANQIRSDGLFHTFCGTPAYVAPEVLSQRGYDGAKVDIWSCGVILFLLMAGHLPFYDRSVVAMYRKIYRGVFRCPRWFSQELIDLLHRLLDVNPQTRITIPEIMENSWFKKGFRHIRFYIEDNELHSITEPEEDGQSQNDPYESGSESDCSVASCPASFSDDHREPLGLPRPQSLTAFDIISFSEGFDLSGLFEETGEMTRFLSKEPAPKIVAKLEEIANVASFKVRGKDCRVFLEGTREGEKGPLTICVEIYELTPSMVVVEVKKKAGDEKEYEEFCINELKPGLKDLMYESPPVSKTTASIG